MEIRNILRATGGRIFKVVFRKRTNGELRTMRARLGVHKNLTGQGLAFEPSLQDLMVVWEMGKGYKMIPTDAVLSLSCGKLRWESA